MRVFKLVWDANRINHLADGLLVVGESRDWNGSLRSALFPVTTLPDALNASERPSRTWQTVVTNPKNNPSKSTQSDELTVWHVGEMCVTGNKADLDPA